ncbi:hypothetical protein B0H13DRAFT_2147680 [Mycena leptocephala]|nr:hypothetical protein B0H13DRAFT_2147680 [Mycena leptocephala]
MSRQTRPERNRRDRHRSSPPDGAISFQSLFLGLSLALASGLAVVAMHSLSSRYSAETNTSSGPRGTSPPDLLPPCAAPTVFETIVSPVETVIIEENSLAPPTSSIRRVQDILRRERRIAERERDVSNSEERVSHREDDASRRERWIMEQLMSWRLHCLV